MKLVLFGLSILAIFSQFNRVSQLSKINNETSEVLSEEIKSTDNLLDEVSRSNADNILQSYIYPGSKVINPSSNSIELESNGDTDEITNWYKEKIKSMEMNVKTYVVTKANDVVKNRLVAAKTDVKVDIEISKKSNNSPTRIYVRLN